MKHVLVDYYSCLNAGDDLFIQVLLERYPSDVLFHIVSDKLNFKPFEKYSNASLVHRIQPNKWLNRCFYFLPSLSEKYKLNCYINSYQSFANTCDIYLNIGGSIFIEGNNIHHYTLKEKSSFFKNRFVLGANFGPYKTEKFKTLIESALTTFDHVCLRDKASFDQLSALKNTSVASDIVFQLSSPDALRSRNGHRVGFSLIDTSKRDGLSQFTQNYLAFIVRQIEINYELGNEIYLYSFCNEEGDSNINQKVLDLVDSQEIKKAIHLISYSGDLVSFTSQFVSMDKVYATRFHANILGLLYKPQLVPISYSKKLNTVFSDMNLDQNINNMADLHVNYIPKTVDLSRYDNQLAATSAHMHFKELDKLLHTEGQLHE